ncbi:hypothetical protein [Elizabethkingia bruuniana]|uniref:hypothetical protein n=1 Tax=Elizabethkingia bruuniana TaxID=1756149 RepID=UPI00241ED51F|nr:hypothetical protein [Elizabethkingia bruuniana]
MDNKGTWIEGDTLFYKDHSNIENANIQSLQYAYVQILGDVLFLFVFADHQHYISTELKGFAEVYQELSDRFGFDDETFFAVCKAGNEDDKVKIWAKKMPRNYQILDEYPDDVDFGYEVYAQPRQMMSWDTTYEQLEASGCVEAYFTDFGARYLRFRYPVRIEGILIDQLEIYADNISTNRPVQEFFVNLYDETNTDKSYQQLRGLWIDDDIDINQYGYEREDQCYLQFVLANGINASICYTYDKEYAYDDGSTSLHFYNKREYRYFLENKEYEEMMEISRLISFHNRLDMKVSYIDHDGVKHIPLKVKELLGGKSGIWIDNTNHKIGFAGIDTALILDLEKIKYFTLQNVLPAKGAGYADLIVHLSTGNYLYVFIEDTYFFDQFAQQLEQMTKKQVEIPEAYYNC